MNGDLRMAGTLGFRKVAGPRGLPIPGFGWRVRNMSRPAFWRGWIGVQVARLVARLFGIPALCGDLRARLVRADGTVIDYGTLGFRVVTTAFVNFVVDQLQTETSVFGDFKYHDSGVGVTSEAVGDTGIETTDGESRATGTQAEGAANAYQSVGTISYTTTKAITEHGLFNDVTAGTLMDRTVFAAINVVNGDSIQFTYTLTLTAGS
jgi:hypothetical protein